MILFLCRQIEVSKKHYTVVSWYSVVHVDGICAKLPRHFFPFSFFSLKILSFFTYFIHVTGSRTATDDVMNWLARGIFNQFIIF